jgi:TolB-like protein
MSKIFSKGLFLVVLCAVQAAAVFAADGLNRAIAKQADYIVGKAAADSRVAIVNIQSGSARLSEYILEQFPEPILKTRKITLVERVNLEVVQREISFQYSGEVSDETMVAIGRKLGAEIIVSGKIIELSTTYAFTIRMVDVETAAVVGSYTTEIEHDSLMEAFFPGSQVARTIKNNSQTQQSKNAETAGKIKNALGIFPSGLYLGYIGSYRTPIGLSFGGINESASLFMDNMFGPPGFKGLDHRTGLTYDDSGINNSTGPFSTDDTTTALVYDGLIGLNVRMIKSFLWLSIGAGVQYRQEYKVFANTAGEESWAKEDGDIMSRLDFIAAAGVLVKIWYLYGQLKYMYVFGDDLGLDWGRIYLGVGYVWKR